MEARRPQGSTPPATGWATRRCRWPPRRWSPRAESRRARGRRRGRPRTSRLRRRVDFGTDGAATQKRPSAGAGHAVAARRDERRARARLAQAAGCGEGGRANVLSLGLDRLVGGAEQGGGGLGEVGRDDVGGVRGGRARRAARAASTTLSAAERASSTTWPYRSSGAPGGRPPWPPARRCPGLLAGRVEQRAEVPGELRAGFVEDGDAQVVLDDDDLRARRPAVSPAHVVALGGEHVTSSAPSRPGRSAMRRGRTPWARLARHMLPALPPAFATAVAGPLHVPAAGAAPGAACGRSRGSRLG